MFTVDYEVKCLEVTFYFIHIINTLVSCSSVFVFRVQLLQTASGQDLKSKALFRPSISLTDQDIQW